MSSLVIFCILIISNQYRVIGHSSPNHSDQISIQPNTIQPNTIDDSLNLTQLDPTTVQVEIKPVNLRIPEYLSDLHFRITYGLSLAYILHYHVKTNSCGPKGFFINSENRPYDIEECKRHLYRFGSFNDTMDKNYTYLEDYCNETTLIEPLSTERKLLVINRLLPHQPYNFIIEIIAYHTTSQDKKYEVLERKEIPICMNDSKPFYPPQTNIGSFVTTLASEDQIEKVKKAAAFRKVELFWRPLPQFFITSDDLYYELECLDSTTNTPIIQPDWNNTKFDKLVGKLELKLALFNNRSYAFKIRSRNEIGSSEYSTIYIPVQDKISSLRGKLNLYVTALSNWDYLLRWNTIDDSSYRTASDKNSSLVDENGRSRRGTYTIYWCPMTGPTVGCSFIEGMISTNKLTLELYIPGAGSPQARSFAISYRSPDKSFYSGLIWADCIATFPALANSQVLRLTSAVGVANNHTAVHLTWEIKGCNSIVSVVDGFEINYCKVSDADVCSSPVVGKNEVDDLADYDFTKSSSNCSRMIFANNLNWSTILNNLTASSRYVIRMKFVLGYDYKQNFPWSNTISVQTLPDPAKAKACIPTLGTTIFLVMAPMGLIVIVIWACKPARKTCVHYWKLVVMYHNAKPDLPTQLHQPTYADYFKSEIREMDGKESSTWDAFWFNDDTISMSDASFTEEPQ